MLKVRINVSGRVQGVGFRYTTMFWAQELGDIHGYVKNLDDGTVYIEAKGPKDKITMFIDGLKQKASYAAFVEKIEVTEDETLEIDDGFRIR